MNEPPDPWRADERFERERPQRERAQRERSQREQSRLEDPQWQREADDETFDEQRFRRASLDDYDAADLTLRVKPLASRLSRLGANILDSLALMLCFGPGLVCLVMGAETPTNSYGPPGPRDRTLAMIGLASFFVLGGGLLLWQTVQLSTRGQSIGKRLVKIRIVRYHDDSNPGFVSVILARSVVPAALGAIPYIGPIFSLFDILSIFGEERRCLHDHIAGTKVVEA